MKDKITIEFLMGKISPTANPNDVEDVKARLQTLNLKALFSRSYRGDEYIVFRLKDIWPHLYGKEKSNIPKLTTLAASLQANFWERSALNGDLIFCKLIKEYEEWGY